MMPLHSRYRLCLSLCIGGLHLTNLIAQAFESGPFKDRFSSPVPAHCVVLPWPVEKTSGKEIMTDQRSECDQNILNKAEAILANYLRNRPRLHFSSSPHDEKVRLEKRSPLTNQDAYVLDHLNDYWRQYAVARSESGQLLLYLNAFCEEGPQGTAHPSDWLKEWVRSESGGACFFHVLVDLSADKVLFFRVNDGASEWGGQGSADLVDRFIPSSK